MSGSWRSLAELTANRLRLIQADLADESAESRAEHLADEVRGALEKVPPADRNSFLSLVEERFPGWEGGRVVTAGDGAAAVAPTDMAEFNDPSFLLQQLLKASGRMSEEQKRAAGERLAAAGLSPAGVGQVPVEAVSKAKAALQVPAGQEADIGRMLEVLSMLAEQVISLDTLVWRTWKQMAPESPHRKRADIGPTMGRYVSGDSEIGGGQVSEDLGRFRQLTAALLASIAQAGETAYRKMAEVGPMQIEAAAKAERKWNESVEVACWKKYVELSGRLDPATVEGDMIRAIASYAEGLMRPRGR